MTLPLPLPLPPPPRRLRPSLQAGTARRVVAIAIALCAGLAGGDGAGGPFARPADRASASMPAQDTAPPATDQASTPVEPEQVDPAAPSDSVGADGTATAESDLDPADDFDPENPFDLARPGTPINAAAASPFALLLPDSEFVYGPTLYRFDTVEFVDAQAGFLSRHLELVDGQPLVGGQIIERVARDYSLGPRMLLAIIELRSGWVSQAQPFSTTEPLGAGSGPGGLYGGLVEAAEALQTLYYAHRIDGARAFPLGDGRSVTLIARNPGTWALTAWLSRGITPEAWAGLEAQSRFWSAWTTLFGDDPYYYQTTETMPPSPLRAPLKLPFADGTIWYLVEGPASPRGTGAARASIGLAPPPAQAGGCLPSFEPVLAIAEGTIIRSEDRGVVLDLDTDEFEGSGWTFVYRHLLPQGRVAAGTRVDAGDPLGFPTCSDGENTLTQVRIARKYHGEWVPADRPDAPWVMGGWTIAPGALAGQGEMILPGLSQRQASPTKVDSVNGIAAVPGR